MSLWDKTLTRMGRRSLLFVMLMTFTIACQQKTEDVVLQEGDFIFQTLDCGPLCEAIMEVTPDFEGQKFNHMGLVFVENDTLKIIEAAGNAVRKVLLTEFLQKSKHPHWVGRLKPEFQSLIPEAITFAKAQIGMPYDDAYVYDNEAYYCSELIYDAFLYARKKPLFTLAPMTFKSQKSDTFFAPWVNYYQDLGIEIPEGELGCNPGGMANEDVFEFVKKMK